MSLLSWVESELSTSEVFVMGLVLKIKTGVQIIEADIATAWNWLAAHAGEISSDAAMIGNGIQTLQAAGIPLPAAANTFITDMNKSVMVLNAAVGASNAGANPLGILVAGYTAAKQAQSSVALAAAAITAAAPKPVSATGSGGS